jgi:hypothetical protein
VCELKLDGVNFAGVASRQEIGRLYDQADIFINASWLDNMPISILEAFACGMPVVTTAPDGIRYIVEHGRTGLLSEPGDAEALAYNVIRILRDPELAERLASNGYEELKRYRWESVREQWLEVYRSLRREAAPEPASRLTGLKGTHRRVAMSSALSRNLKSGIWSLKSRGDLNRRSSKTSTEYNTRSADVHHD